MGLPRRVAMIRSALAAALAARLSPPPRQTLIARSMALAVVLPIRATQSMMNVRKGGQRQLPRCSKSLQQITDLARFIQKSGE